MKTLLQRIHLEEQESFACRSYKTPSFETNWHKHEEAELILITEGHGTVMMGDYIGEYKSGDIYFMAGNLPHWFKKQHHKMTGGALVIHFKKDIFGQKFLQLPELKMIDQFLEKDDGIQLQEKEKKVMAGIITVIQTAKGQQRLLLLLQCLQQLSVSKYDILTHNFILSSNHINPAIEKIIDFSFKRYLTPVTLQQVADVASMSIPTFCRFFKKNIKKTYFDFLQDLRISHACKLLTNSDKPIMEICYESGYNSWAHFSKQFKNVKEMTPSQYRKEFEEKGV